MVTVSPSGPPGLFKGVTTAMSGVLARFPLLLPVRNSFVGCGGAEAGEALIGKTVSVYWPCDHQWYTAKVVGHEVGTQPLESLPSTATPGGEGTITSGARGGGPLPSLEPGIEDMWQK